MAATVTAGFILLLTASLLWLADPVFDSFESGSNNPRWYVLGFCAVVGAVSLFADVVALFVLRGRRWAQWVLLSLCIATALAGLMTSYYVAPLLVTAAAVAVAVMLLLPQARAWFRTSRTT